MLPELKTLSLVAKSDWPLFEQMIREYGLIVLGKINDDPLEKSVQLESIEAISTSITEDRDEFVTSSELVQAIKQLAADQGYIVAEEVDETIQPNMPPLYPYHDVSNDSEYESAIDIIQDLRDRRDGYTTHKQYERDGYPERWDMAYPDDASELAKLEKQHLGVGTGEPEDWLQFQKINDVSFGLDTGDKPDSKKYSAQDILGSRATAESQ